MRIQGCLVCIYQIICQVSRRSCEHPTSQNTLEVIKNRPLKSAGGWLEVAFVRTGARSEDSLG